MVNTLIKACVRVRWIIPCQDWKQVDGTTGFPGQASKPQESVRCFTWKCCNQRAAAQLATVVGGGGVERAEVQIRSCRPSWGIKNGSCPVADLFKARTDVLIPLLSPRPLLTLRGLHSSTSGSKQNRRRYLSQERSTTLDLIRLIAHPHPPLDVFSFSSGSEWTPRRCQLSLDIKHVQISVTSTWKWVCQFQFSAAPWLQT